MEDRLSACRLAGGGAGGNQARAAAEMLADEADGDRALADGGGHPLDGATAHVADREHPGQAGL